MRHAPDSKRHGDERRPIEDHIQTAQKLGLYRTSVGQWGNILAKAHLPRSVTDLFLIDTHCGAGQHSSREHPDGRVFGSPLIACHEARRLQRRYPGIRVHVRAIDSDRRWIGHLRQRTDPFLTAQGVDQVDVQLFPDDFAPLVPHLLAEAESRGAPSLWLVDPYGIRIPHSALVGLQDPEFGPEVIINLDMLGIWRVGAFANRRLDDRFEEVVLGDPGAQRCLNDLFGSRVWEKVTDWTRSFRENVPALAAAYAEQFPEFEYRRNYPLYASHGQVRQIIHLCHSRLGSSKFYDAYVHSQNFGLLAGRHPDGVSRAHAARRYWEAYRGEATTVTRLYEEGIQAFDRGQIRAICVTAEEERFGRFDEGTVVMSWHDERLPESPAPYQPPLFS